MLMLLYAHFMSLFDFTRAFFFPIDFAHGAHQASNIIVDLVKREWKEKKEPSKIRWKNGRTRKLLQQ